MLKLAIEAKLQQKVEEAGNNKTDSSQKLEADVFNRLMTNEEIPFGMTFSGMKTLRKVFEEEIDDIYEKIDNVSNLQIERTESMTKKLMKIK